METGKHEVGGGLVIKLNIICSRNDIFGSEMQKTVAQMTLDKNIAIVC